MLQAAHNTSSALGRIITTYTAAKRAAASSLPVTTSEEGGGPEKNVTNVEDPNKRGTVKVEDVGLQNTGSAGIAQQGNRVTDSTQKPEMPPTRNPNDGSTLLNSMKLTEAGLRASLSKFASTLQASDARYAAALQKHTAASAPKAEQASMPSLYQSLVGGAGKQATASAEDLIKAASAAFEEEKKSWSPERQARWAKVASAVTKLASGIEDPEEQAAFLEGAGDAVDAAEEIPEGVDGAEAEEALDVPPDLEGLAEQSLEDVTVEEVAQVVQELVDSGDIPEEAAPAIVEQIVQETGAQPGPELQAQLEELLAAEGGEGLEGEEGVEGEEGFEGEEEIDPAAEEAALAEEAAAGDEAAAGEEEALAAAAAKQASYLLAA